MQTISGRGGTLRVFEPDSHGPVLFGKNNVFHFAVRSELAEQCLLRQHIAHHLHAQSRSWRAADQIFYERLALGKMGMITKNGNDLVLIHERIKKHVTIAAIKLKLRGQFHLGEFIREKIRP